MTVIKELIALRDHLVVRDMNMQACLIDKALEELKSLTIKYSDLALKNEKLENELEQASSLNRIMALKLQEDHVPF